MKSSAKLPVFLLIIGLVTTTILATYITPGAPEGEVLGATSTNLIGHWDFNEGEGDTLTDKSISGNNGLLIREPEWIKGVGLSGHALDFDGIDDYVDIDTDDKPILFNDQSYSASLWVKFDTETETAGKAYPFITHRFNRNDPNGRNFGIGNQALWNRIAIQDNDGSSNKFGHYHKPSEDIHDDKWHHLAWTYDNETKEQVVYFDMEKVTMRYHNGGLNLKTGKFFIAKSVNEFCDCSIDEIKIYDTKLSDQEINGLFEEPFLNEKLVGHWSFDEESDPITIDSSTSGHNGEIIGDPQIIEGIQGKALRFDGIDDGIKVPITDGVLHEESPFTVSLWARFNNPEKGNPLFGYRFYEANTLRAVINWQAQNDRLIFQSSGQTGFTGFRTNNILPDPNNEWMNIVFMSDGSGNHRVYKDGKEVDSLYNQAGGRAPNIGQISIGYEKGDWCDCDIDEVKIYNYEISSSDILDEYENLSGNNLEFPTPPAFSSLGDATSIYHSVEMFSQNEDRIYYTTDGSMPTIQSNQYFEPLFITEDTTITAASFNGLFSLPITQTYTVVGIETISKTSNPQSVLPQNNVAQTILRNYLGGLEEADFVVNYSNMTWSDTLATTSEELFQLKNVLGYRGREMALFTGVSLHPKYFTLPWIEYGDEINMGKNTADPMEMAFWASWNHPINPYNQEPNRTAILNRVMSSAITDLVMYRDYYKNRTPRSDYLGGTFLWLVDAFENTEHIMPEQVRDAFLHELMTIFSTLENLPVTTVSGSDMTTFEMWASYKFASLFEDAKMLTRWKERFKKIVDTAMMADNHLYTHGNNNESDLSYEGIARYFNTGLAIESQDVDILDIVSRMEKLKSELTFVDPDGRATGPTNASNATNKPISADQWWTSYRDVSLGQINDNSLYLPWVRGPISWLNTDGSIMNEAELRASMPIQVTRANNWLKLSQAGTQVPKVWKEKHWASRVNYLEGNQTTGHYSRLLDLESSNSDLLKPPVLRQENYINNYSDDTDKNDFVTFKFDDFAGVIHPYRVRKSWAGKTPAGISGGDLSGFWTPETGSLILGRTGGTQSNTSDSWDSINDHTMWAVNDIFGTANEGKRFSTATILKPSNSVQTGSNSEIAVDISGLLGTDVTDPENGIINDLNYSRKFIVSETGIQITSRLRGNEPTPMETLYERIPLVTRLKQQTPGSDAEMIVSLKVGESWVPASTDITTNVKSVRMERFGGQAYINFDQARSVKISEQRTIDDIIISNLMIDWLDGASSIPLDSSMFYTISTIEMDLAN